MPLEPTLDDFYDEILAKLREARAVDLAEEIERTSARGVVIREQHAPQTVAVYRPAEGNEGVAIALEFLITALEVPLMLSSTGHALGNDSIEWRSERPSTEGTFEVTTASLETQVDQQELDVLLRKIHEIAQELQITLPQLA